MMPVEWFYQHEVDGKLGPLSSEQLAELARRGVVLPSTPVQRRSDARVSPWRRSGDIKGLFSHEVSAELGGPICGECGSLLRDDVSCPQCSPPPPSPSHTLADVLASGEVPPRFTHAEGDASHDLWLPPKKAHAASRTPEQRVNEESGRYANLRAYIYLLSVANKWASILVGLGILLTLFFTYANEKSSGYDSPNTFIGCVIVGGVTFLGYLATAAAIDFATVVLHIESHARQIELNTRPRPEQPDGDSSE